jgi:hypothetical protein
VVVLDYHDILEQAKKYIEERHPEASPQKRAAFANSVAYLVTGLSGGYGGPSVREHAAARLYGPGGRHSFEEACRLLEQDDGPIFGPISELHRACWRDEFCFDDDPEDLRVLGAGR